MKKFALALLFVATAAQAAITGTLVDETGKPVAGAKIRAYAAAALAVTSARIIGGKFDQPVIASAESAENGTFKIDVKAPVADLMIEAVGQQPHIEEAADGDDLNVIVLHPKPGRKVRAVSNGKPVANATLVSGPYVAHSDADGILELPDTAGARTTIVHSDFAPAPAFFAPDEGLGPHEIVLNHGVAIRGRALNADGQPVANATITVSGWPLAKSGADGGFTVAHAPANWRTMIAIEGNRAGAATNSRAASYDIRLRPAASISGTTAPGSRLAITFGTEPDSTDSVLADAQGKFTSGPLPAGRYAVHSFRRWYSMASADVTVQEGAQVTRTLTPRALGLIRGRVVDEQKQPVTGAFVGYNMLGGRAGLVMTGSNGEFAVRRLERMTSPIVAVKAGYAAGSSAVGKADLAIVLPRGFPVQVFVIDHTRKPVAGALLSIATGSVEDDYMSHVEVACEQPLAANCRLTPDTGTIHLRATEGPYMVRVSGQSIAAKMLPTQTITAKSSPLTIEVDRGVEVSGRVKYGDGSPVTDGFVNVRSFGAAMARLDADGNFTIHNVLPGKVALVASTTPGRVESARVEVEAPARGVVITIPTPARIEGRVTDKQTGAPITDFQVAAGVREGRSSGAPQTIHTDDGSYALDRVSPGVMQLQFAAAGYARGTLGNVTAEEAKTVRGVDIQLDKGGSIRGHVTANGEPVSGVFVHFGEPRGPSGPMAAGMTFVMTDDNGDYLIDGIADGDRTLQFSKQGFVNLKKNVTVEKGKEARLDVQLDSGRELQGRVLDKNGQPIASARVSAMALGGFMGVRPVTTDASGAFTMSGLGDGRYNVTASKEGLVSAQANDVVVPATAPLTLTLDTGGTLTGRVTGLTDAELAATEVSVNGSGTFAHTQVNPDGTFTMRGVPDGHVAVSAFVRGGMHPRQSVVQSAEVVSGSAAPVQIDFNEGLTVTGHVMRNGTPVTSGNVMFAGKTGRNAMIGSDGSYEIDGLMAGDYQVSVYGQGGMLYGAKYTVSASTNYDIAIQGATVTGRVLDASTGAPISEATIATTATKDNPIMRQTMTDSEGNFTLDAIGDGPIEIRAAHDQYAPGAQTITVNGGSAPNVEIRLDAAQPTIFRVTDAQTGAPMDANINVIDGKKSVAQSHRVRDDDGGIRVYVAPGHYRASVYARGYTSQMVEFSAPSSDVRVALSLGGKILITASKPTRVSLRSSAPPAPGVGGSIRSTFTVNPGSFPIESLAPGTYFIDVMGDSGNVVLKSIPVTIYAGQTTTISVD